MRKRLKIEKSSWRRRWRRWRRRRPTISASKFDAFSLDVVGVVSVVSRGGGQVLGAATEIDRHAPQRRRRRRRRRLFMDARRRSRDSFCLRLFSNVS